MQVAQSSGAHHSEAALVVEVHHGWLACCRARRHMKTSNKSMGNLIRNSAHTSGVLRFPTASVESLMKTHQFENTYVNVQIKDRFGDEAQQFIGKRYTNNH